MHGTADAGTRLPVTRVHVLNGKHKGHTARLREFDGDEMTAVCANCGGRVCVLRPSQVTLTDDEVFRLRQSYENYQRGGRRDEVFWRNWQLADGGVLARRA